MISFALFMALIALSQSCVPTQVITTTTTTTTPCCPMLSQTSLPRRNPSSQAFEQCSILRRMSSNCPIDGIVFCDAADQTNPNVMQIEFFNSAGAVVRTVQNSGSSLSVNVYCRNGVWNVRSSSSSTTFIPITQVSCAQNGSTGFDAGYVVGSATN